MACEGGSCLVSRSFASSSGVEYPCTAGGELVGPRELEAPSALRYVFDAAGEPDERRDQQRRRSASRAAGHGPPELEPVGISKNTA
jgi:hypothetical protein